MSLPGFLNLNLASVAYSDTTSTANPKKRNWDWKSSVQSLPILAPTTQSFSSIAPGTTQLVFSGGRTLTMDGTTTFAVSLAYSAGTYRITWTGGTAPGFRTDRGLALTGKTATMTANINGSETMVLSAGSSLAGVVAGDILYIPGVLNQFNTSPFNPENQGFWTVLSVNSLTLQLARFVNNSFQGASEVVPITSNSQVSCFSSAGVQIGDVVELIAGFSPSSLAPYIVSNVTSTYFEFSSGNPLSLDVGVLPGATGIAFYTNAKRFVRVEVDQEAAVQFNGDTNQYGRLSPISAGDPDNMGFIDKWGLCYSLSVVNRSGLPLNINVFSCE